MRVLGISLGTTTSGVAVISGGQLICWHIHSFRDRWSADKATAIAARYERYVTQYRPRIIVVKIPPLYHHTESIKQLLKKLAVLFQYHGCMVEYTTKEAVKADIIKNNKELMKHATELYPILRPEYESALAGKNRYHAKLFDAVMAAHRAAMSSRKSDG
jgi:RNase H-fold protein (predicted Holliday junction resolvase)